MGFSPRFLVLVLSGLLSGIAAAAPPKAPTLPISLADVMRASVEIPPDGIRAAEGPDKLAEDDWQLADQEGVNLIAATQLIARAGAGKNDAKWVANADWQNWVRDMEKASLQIRSAVKAMNQKEMAAAADHLQDVCESCHTKYQPRAPPE